MLFFFGIFTNALISEKLRTLWAFRGMLAYIYYTLDWDKVFSCDNVEIVMATELLYNTGAADGLIEFCWPLLEKEAKSILCSKLVGEIVSNNS